MTNIEFFKTKDACAVAFRRYTNALDRARRLKLQLYRAETGAPEYVEWLFHPASTALAINITSDAGTYVTADGNPGVAKYHVPSSCSSTEWPVFLSFSVVCSSNQQRTVGADLVKNADLPPGFYSVTVNALIENIKEGRESEQSIARILSAIQDRRNDK